MKYILILGGLGLLLYLINKMQASGILIYIPGYGYVQQGTTVLPGATIPGMTPTTTTGMPTMGVAGPSATPASSSITGWAEITGGPGLR